jgi:hypothetical protein
MKQRILTKVRRVWEHELVRYMGYLEWEDGKKQESGIPRLSRKEARNDAKKMLDELDGNL